MSSTENPYLETLSYRETPLIKDRKKRFFHATLAYLPSPKVFLEWKSGKKEKKKIKKKDTYTLPYSHPEEFFNGRKDGILWL
jgi:hypothetical protein